jgi:transposase
VRTIAQSVGVGRTTVAEYLRRTAVIGITWPVPAEIDDADLERRLFMPAGFYPVPTRPMPDWTHVHAELRRRGVTLLLLWEEYRAEHGDGYGYSRFCDLYIEWRRGVSATIRQTHVAGEKLFVDYAGDTVPVFDGVTGEERRAHVFVAVLGASNYTYAEARWSEGLADWIGAHVNALSFLCGVPKLLVCDNLRAGVTAACRYEPGINRTYQDLAAHYQTAVLPARVRHPRDKAKVETAVLIVERFILARLRNRRFLSLGELNEAIREVQGDLNGRLMRKLGASRREFFDTIDRPALLALPTEPYAYAEWRRCRVAPDYHVEVHGHFYSVPSRLIREVVEAPHHRHHDRGVPRRQAGRGAPALGAAAPAHHDAGAHAERAPALRRQDAGAHPILRRADRPRHRRPGRDDHAHQAASRAGVQGLPWDSAAGQELRRHPAGSRLPARPDDRRADLCLGCLDPAHRIGPGFPRRRSSRGGPPAARQHPRPRLLSLRRTSDACPSHPGTPACSRSRRHGPRVR